MVLNMVCVVALAATSGAAFVGGNPGPGALGLVIAGIFGIGFLRAAEQEGARKC